MTTPRLATIICSTRPGRVGHHVGRWFHGVASSHTAFDPVLIDLAQVGLPLLDEPNHPLSGQYTREHTLNWSQQIDEVDAVVFVVPEYNHSFNAASKNAIDYLNREWNDKSVGFVSYGGVAGGTRAVQALKPVILAVKAVPVLESVNIPGIGGLIVKDTFAPPEGLEDAALVMLDELARREHCLSNLRPVRAAKA